MTELPNFDPAPYEEEARRRWGATDAYRQAKRRTDGYTQPDWERIHREGEEITQAFLGVMAAGLPADGAEARAVAERHRAHITKWFYDCSPEMHAGLGRMYVTDQRFAATFEGTGPGLAAYISHAIAANAARA